MLTYILKRLGWMLATLWVVFTVSFFLMRFVPGGPFDSDRHVDKEIAANMNRRYHLDEPLVKQYLRELGNAARGDLGIPYKLRDYTVNGVIAEGLPISAALGLLALAFAVSLGLVAGITSAARRGSFADWALMTCATIGIALPNFVIAGVAIMLFVFLIPIFPAAGWGSFDQLILPALCLGAPHAADVARITRTSMLDVLSQDHIRTARAKGLSRTRVIWGHAVPGALLPVVSYLGPATAYILTGSLVIEQIFAIPGLGSHFVRAAIDRDYTLALGCVMVYTLILSTMNLLVDLSYTVLDPRVELDWMATAAAKSTTTDTGVSLGKDAWRKLRKNRVAMICLGLLVTIAALAFLTPLLPLQPPDAIDTPQKYAPPQFSPLWQKSFVLETVADAHPKTMDAADIQRPYRNAGFPYLSALSRAMVRARYALFGTGQIASVCGRDELGRDLLSRVFWGARISLIVGLVAAGVSLVIGVTYGSIAGYVGGRLDNAMMRFVDVLYSIPFIFVVIFLLTILSEEHIKKSLMDHGISRLTIFYFVVGAIYWLTMARVVRGQVISLKTEPFVEAARAMGVSQAGIIARHIFPNLVGIVIVYLTLTIPRVMLFEAFLSFLGLGVEPPDVSWGLLANEGIKVITPVKTYWWLIVYPSLALGLTLYALNFLGDGLRDALDPKLAGRRQ